MKIPKSVKILGHNVDISVSDDPNHISNGDCACCDPDQNSIRICSHFPESVQALSLCHEIVHMVFYAMGEELGTDLPHTEKVVEAFSAILFQVLRENPKMDFADREL